MIARYAGRTNDKEIMHIYMKWTLFTYPDFGYKQAHEQSVCTRPFLPRREGPGDEASMYVYVHVCTGTALAT